MKIAQIGLGPIGIQVVKYITQRQGLEVVAAVDNDPEKAGNLLNDVCDFEAPEILIHSDLTSALQNAAPDIAVVTTVSKLSRIENLLTEVANSGLHIVSTCEELTYPWETQPAIAQRIDAVCKTNGVSCLSTGVNPGFLMDYLPAALTSVCQKVDHVRIERKQNASFRRGPFQQKIGVGLTPGEFEKKKESIAHVGLPESTYMIAKALNWQSIEMRETISPVVAETGVSSNGVSVSKNYVLGVRQIAKGFLNEREVIHLEFKAAIGEDETQDVIEIAGIPSIRSVIEGGVNGDIATAAITVNATRSVLKLQPGLKTMLDIPVTSYFDDEATVPV